MFGRRKRSCSLQWLCIYSCSDSILSLKLWTVIVISFRRKCKLPKKFFFSCKKWNILKNSVAATNRRDSAKNKPNQKQKWRQACRRLHLRQVWCQRKHATFKGKKKKNRSAGEIIIATKVNIPWCSFQPPAAERHSSCLSLMSFRAWGQIYDLSSDMHVHLCACSVREHTHTPRIDLFPPHQHSDNTEKPICSAATSRKENMSNSHSEGFFFFLLSFQGHRKGFRTFILIFTHNLHLWGEARWRPGRVGIGREGKKKNKKTPRQPDVLHWRQKRAKLCGILEWATPPPLQRKHHPSSPPRAPAGIRRWPTPAGSLHIWGELSGGGGHVGKHLQLCLKVGLNARQLW